MAALRSIVRVASGNFLEMYDFMVFGYYAGAIGHAFFPAGNPFVSLMLALMTFGAGFLMRPLGAVILGAYADRHGRRAGLLLTLALFFCSSNAFAQETPSNSDEIQIRQLERAWNQAEANQQVNEVSNLVDDTLVYTDYDGSILTKGQFLASISPRRYFCTECHVPQNVTNPPVSNDFVDIDTLLKHATPGDRQ